MMSKAGSLQRKEGMLPAEYTTVAANSLLISALLKRDDAFASIAEMRWLKSFHSNQPLSVATERDRSDFVLSMESRAIFREAAARAGIQNLPKSYDVS